MSKEKDLMEIRFIYFDLGRVLLDFTHEQGFQQIATVTGLTPDVVNKALVGEGLSDRYETGELSTAEFHSKFCELTKSTPTVEELTQAWADIFSIIPASVGVASSLKAAGYRVGILSNTCEAHWEFARKKFRVLDQLFEPVITSYEVRSMKPDAGIYQAAAKAANCEPSELFFIDDREENVEGARSQGWNAELFTSPLKLANDLERLGLEFNR